MALQSVIGDLSRRKKEEVLPSVVLPSVVLPSVVLPSLVSSHQEEGRRKKVEGRR